MIMIPVECIECKKTIDELHQRDLDFVREQLIDTIIIDYINMQDKYGLDFCPTLFIKHIRKLKDVKWKN